MKEITDILNAYRIAQKQNLKTALATVVQVEGSSYRRAGARMLITENGMLTGAISGGCLEGDALKKALSAIHVQENRLVTYDTTDEDDAKFGVQLGCNGIVHILFEPIIAEQGTHPIAILEALQEKRANAVVVSLFNFERQRQLGTVLLYRDGNQLTDLPPALQSELMGHADQSLTNKHSDFRTYQYEGETVHAFIEFISPPIALVIVGAGNDAQPLAEFAYLLGWQVTIADGRQTHATKHRFASAERILITKPVQLMPQLEFDEQTAIVLMTHNYNYDTELLGMLLKTPAPYIGTLGPRKKLIRMLDELDMNTGENKDRVHGPVGLDIGAETAEEIAISIIAEIKSKFARGTGKSLKEKTGAILEFFTNEN